MRKKMNKAPKPVTDENYLGFPPGFATFVGLIGLIKRDEKKDE